MTKTKYSLCTTNFSLRHTYISDLFLDRSNSFIQPLPPYSSLSCLENRIRYCHNISYSGISIHFNEDQIKKKQHYYRTVNRYLKVFVTLNILKSFCRHLNVIIFRLFFITQLQLPLRQLGRLEFQFPPVEQSNVFSPIRE